MNWSQGTGNSSAHRNRRTRRPHRVGLTGSTGAVPGPQRPRTRRALVRGASVAAALAGVAAGSLAAPNPASATTAGGEPREPRRYVALGDSMASGPLIPGFTGPLGCGRSTHNYPHELAERIGAAELRDVTCSGATTEHTTQPQETEVFGHRDTQPPQFDALSADTTLVTVTLGGNDAGLVGVAEDCVRLNPRADACRPDHEEEVDRRIEETGPKVRAVIRGIVERAPSARVLATGYGNYVKPGGCWPVQPILGPDADWLQSRVDALNTEIERAVTATGAEYVDVRTPSEGHDACQPPGEKWIEGYVPTAAAAPLHPNRRGEENYARIVHQRLTSASGTSGH